MKAFAVRYPYLFGILVSLAGILGTLWPAWIPGLPLYAQIVLGRATDCLIAAVLLAVLAWWREVGFVPIRSWRVLIPYAPLILVVLLIVMLVVVIPGSQVRDPALILFGAVSFLAGGFVEEALFRGVVLRTFLPCGLLKASLLSATVFSLVHLANLLMGQDLNATILQLVRAFLLGFAFVAPLAYTRNIWPLVILHAAINFSSFLGTGSITLVSTESPEISEVLAEVAVFGLLAGYGFWLLYWAERKTKAKAAIVEQPFAWGDGRWRG